MVQTGVRATFGAMVFMLAAHALGQVAGMEPAANLPFKIGDNTTVVSGPLNPDGTIDYVAALNDKLSRDVTPENNGFVVWLKIMGTNAIGKEARADFVDLSGSKDAPAVGWVDWSVLNGSGAQETKRDRELMFVTTHVWKESDYPDFAQYLKDREALMALAPQAVARGHWWSPAVGANDAVCNVLLPALGPMRNVCRTMCARALLRAGNGDFDGFLSDVMTVKRLIRMAGGWAGIDVVVKDFIDQMADRAMAAAVGSGMFSSQQCAELVEELDALGPIQSMADTVDVGERFSTLDFVQALAMGTTSRMLTGDKNGDRWVHTFDPIDRNSVDWDEVMQRLNAADDELVKIMKNPSARAELEAQKAFDQRIDREDNKGKLSKSDNETPEAYALRIAVRVISSFTSPVGAKQKEWQAQMAGDLTRAIVAAAQYRADNGKWPQTLGELSPKYLATMPVDIFSRIQGTPPVYKAGPDGIWIYSVGPNGRDDNGRSDDIVEGVIPNSARP
jgi:hypothetical protein